MSPDYTPHRIVSLQPSATSTLAAIDKLDCVVACTKYCIDVCPEVRALEIPLLEDSWTASSDQIIAARPDLVVASVPYQEKAVSEILKSGVRFLGLAPRTLADIYGDIASISNVMGVAARGQQVIQEMQEAVEAVRQETARKPRPKVFCEEWGKPLIASQSWVAELVEAAGGEFIGSPGTRISESEVLQQNPDVVVAAWCGAGDRVPLKKIVADRKWEHMAAVQAGRVYCVPDHFLNTPALPLLHGLRALAAAIHPEDFEMPPGVRCITGVPVRAQQAVR